MEYRGAARARASSWSRAKRLLELARSVKCAEEIECMRESLAVADIAMARMRNALRPGLTENELWAELHHANIAHGGEWIETRLLSSGPRTNPWFQEASDRRIQAGELVSFDTDMIGPYGYCADVSRTFFCEPGTPTALQRQLYGLAAEQVAHNCDLLRPGRSFPRLWRIGVEDSGALFRSELWLPAARGGPGRRVARHRLRSPRSRSHRMANLFPGMTVCVESYIGEVGGSEGVKLEQQVLITDTRPRNPQSLPAGSHAAVSGRVISE